MTHMNMRNNNTKGLLITFCGLDGCGKTTMINRLLEDLTGECDVMLTKQPTDYVRQSKIFRTYMDEPVHDEYDYRSLSLLAASDRIQHVNKVIVPAMNEGKIVLSDRYYYSCLANLRARGYTQDRWIYEIAENIIFDVPVDIAVARVRERVDERNRYIDMELQYRLRDEYISICEANDGVYVPTTESEETTYETVLKEVRRVMLR